MEKIASIVTEIYSDCWHKVEYDIKEVYINFKAFTIESLDEEILEHSEFSEEPVIIGFIKWDGCMEFNYNTHYCGIQNAIQFLELMKHIYEFNKTKVKESLPYQQV